MDREDLDREEVDREIEKLRRRQKLARRVDESEDSGFIKRKGRLDPYDKKARKYDWKSELDEEDEDGSNRDDSDD